VRIETAIADGKREQLGQQVPEAVAVVAVERLRAAVGKNRDGVGRDGLDALEQHRGNLVAQVLLQRNAAFGDECRVVDAHEQDAFHVHRSTVPTQAQWRAMA